MSYFNMELSNQEYENKMREEKEEEKKEEEVKTHDSITFEKKVEEISKIAELDDSKPDDETRESDVKKMEEERKLIEALPHYLRDGSYYYVNGDTFKLYVAKNINNEPFQKAIDTEFALFPISLTRIVHLPRIYFKAILADSRTKEFVYITTGNLFDILTYSKAYLSSCISNELQLIIQNKEIDESPSFNFQFITTLLNLSIQVYAKELRSIFDKHVETVISGEVANEIFNKVSAKEKIDAKYSEMLASLDKTMNTYKDVYVNDTLLNWINTTEFFLWKLLFIQSYLKLMREATSIVRNKTEFIKEKTKLITQAKGITKEQKRMRKQQVLDIVQGHENILKDANKALDEGLFGAKIESEYFFDACNREENFFTKKIYWKDVKDCSMDMKKALEKDIERHERAIKLLSEAKPEESPYQGIPSEVRVPHPIPNDTPIQVSLDPIKEERNENVEEAIVDKPLEKEVEYPHEWFNKDAQEEEDDKKLEELEKLEKLDTNAENETKDNEF